MTTQTGGLQGLGRCPLNASAELGALRRQDRAVPASAWQAGCSLAAAAQAAARAASVTGHCSRTESRGAAGPAAAAAAAAGQTSAAQALPRGVAAA